MIAVENCAAIVAAAGLSSRFGPDDKLMTLINDEPLLSWSLAPVLKAGLSQIVVVTGANDDAVRRLFSRAPVAFVNNPTPAAGLGASIAKGAAAIDDHVEGVFICLGDMPLTPADAFKQLAQLLGSDEACDAAAPVYNGRRGHPVLFHRRHMAALRNLNGDDGARTILNAPGMNMLSLNVADEGALRDMDVGEDLDQLERILKARDSI